MEGSRNMLFIADVPRSELRIRQNSEARAIMSELCQQHSQHQLKGSNSWSPYLQVAHLISFMRNTVMFRSLANSLSLVGSPKGERRDTPQRSKIQLE
jgi:hypothetical protein